MENEGHLAILREGVMVWNAWRKSRLDEADVDSVYLSVEAEDEAYSLSFPDLSGADLRGLNLSHADLSGARLSSADLRGADLRCQAAFSPPRSARGGRRRGR